MATMSHHQGANWVSVYFVSIYLITEAAEIFVILFYVIQVVY
jgi:hypothetical protein